MLPSAARDTQLINIDIYRCIVDLELEPFIDALLTFHGYKNVDQTQILRESSAKETDSTSET